MDRSGINRAFTVLGGVAAAVGLVAGSAALVGSSRSVSNPIESTSLEKPSAQETTNPSQGADTATTDTTDALDPSGRDSAQGGSIIPSQESETESSEIPSDTSDYTEEPSSSETPEPSEPSRSPEGYPDDLMGVDGVVQRGSDLVYIVQEGDTLSDISRKLGISVDRLARANNVNNVHLIYSNSSLVVPERAIKIPR